MLIGIIILTAAVTAAGVFLLALASDAFAYEVSRGVEAAFEFVEYRSALRRHSRRQVAPQQQAAAREPRAAGTGRLVYEASYSHAG